MTSPPYCSTLSMITSLSGGLHAGLSSTTFLLIVLLLMTRGYTIRSTMPGASFILQFTPQRERSYCKMGFPKKIAASLPEKFSFLKKVVRFLGGEVWNAIQRQKQFLIRSTLLRSTASGRPFTNVI